MNFTHTTAETYVPDGLPLEQALARTTHLCIAAHQDDIEIMAAGPILDCFQQRESWFTGVVVCDGRGSPRDNLYKNYNDEEMRVVRFKEQRKAAFIGEYSAQVMLDYSSGAVKTSAGSEAVQDILHILRATKPKFVFTHNIADKHDTHVAVALRTIEALRCLDVDELPQMVIGCEVWRGLDWLLETDKISMDLSERETIQSALINVFDSQIAGGKRYDLASMGRRHANATFFEAHGVDRVSGVSYGMDMTRLARDHSINPAAFAQDLITHMAQDVAARIARVG